MIGLHRLNSVKGRLILVFVVLKKTVWMDMIFEERRYLTQF